MNEKIIENIENMMNNEEELRQYLTELKNRGILTQAEVNAKIAELFENKELYAKMAENCKEIYNEKFTEEVYTRNIEKIYMEGRGQ